MNCTIGGRDLMHNEISNNCILTHLHVCAEPKGTMRSCCIARELIKHNDGTIYSVHNDTIGDILNSDFMKNLRQQLRNGEKPSNCSPCWEDESKGKESKRQIYNNVFLNWEQMNVDWDSEPKNPVDLQLSIGNVCNLKCRTCAPSHSSKWVKEIKERKTQNWSKENWQAYVGNAKESFTLDESDSKIWQDIDNWSQTVRRLEIMGGEPFYTKSFRKLIDKLIANGTSKHIKMNLSTNGTMFDQKFINLLFDNFENLGINLSIDGIGKHFDYIRHGGNWKVVESNLVKFHKMLEVQKSTQALIKLGVSVTTTISSLNFYYLRDIHQYFEDNFPLFKIWNNPVYTPLYYRISNIPNDVKTKYLDRIVNPMNYGLSNWSSEKYEDILSIVNHAKVDCNIEEWNNFLLETNRADIYRNENFKETFPELYDVLRSHWKEIT